MNELVDDLLNEIETNLRVAELKAAMLPKLECVQAFRHKILDFIQEELPDLRQKITQHNNQGSCTINPIDEAGLQHG